MVQLSKLDDVPKRTSTASDILHPTDDDDEFTGSSTGCGQSNIL
jgi:hypothetical protein